MSDLKTNRMRVGFVMPHGESWVGGVNYFNNLLHAITAVPDRKIDPVLFIPEDAPASNLVGFPRVEIVRSSVFGGGKQPGKFERKIARVLFGRDHRQNKLFREHNIAVHSHAGRLKSRQLLPTMSWIADFQHVHHPHFFSAKEIDARDNEFRSVSKNAAIILVSSENAKRDLENYMPEGATKARVLRFVSGLAANVVETPREVLAAKYGIDRPFFHLPNQFWVHKNHAAVLKALSILKSRGRSALIVATGNTRDYRVPHHFDELKKEIDLNGLHDSFPILGLIPYGDLAALMRHSIAVINPSFFEGWSTTVEEAKSLGKRVLLSDIAVHREQSPERADFFDPNDPEALADALERALADYDPAAEIGYRRRAEEQLPSRFTEFGQNYEAIALEAARIGR
jgi:glycosyltransferase involved in cell wall biosynthesis